MTSRVHIDVDAFISSDDDDNSTSNSSSFKSGGGGEDGGSNANATLIPTTSSVVHQSNIRTSDRERREHSLSQSRAIAVEGIDEMTDNSPTQSGAIAEDMTAIVSRSRFLPARYHDSFYKHMHGLSRQLSPSSSVDNVDALTETPTAAIYPSHHQEQPALLPDVSHLDRYSSLPVASLVVAGSPPPSNNPAVPTIDDSKTQATHRRWRIVALVIALFVVSIFVAITLGLLFVRPLLESSASVPVPQQQSQPPIIAPVEGVSVAPSSFPVPSPTVKPTIRPVASNLPTTAPQKTEQPTIPAPKKVTNVPLPQKVTNAPLSTAPIMNLTTFAPSSRAPVTTALPATAAPAFSPSSVAPRDVFLINCGSNQDFTDSNGRIWMSDRYFGNGVARTSTSSVLNESNAVLYQTYRESLDWEELTYSIPVPEGEYNVVMHFAETVFNQTDSRVFTVMLEEGQEVVEIGEVDVFLLAGGQNRALTRTASLVLVTDRTLDITFVRLIENPTVAAIEVIWMKEHRTHAFAGGPYVAVDSDGDGFGNVSVSADESHTHGSVNRIVLYTWTTATGDEILGTGLETQLSLPVGNSTVRLTVVDSSGSVDSDDTVIRVEPQGYAVIFEVSPLFGPRSGGTVVTITGQGIGDATAVRFGPILLTSGNFTVVDLDTITIETPNAGVAIAVLVSVIAPLGESNAATFAYV